MSFNIIHRISHDEAEQTMFDIEMLAKKVYQSSIVLPGTLLYHWYQRNPSMWWIAKINNHLIGYICAIPLNNRAFRKTLQADFDEQKHITNEDIRLWNEDPSDESYSLYICSMVVDPEYQNRSDLPVFRLLVEHFLESLLFYGKNGSIVREWSGMAVSKGGCHVLKHYFDLTYLFDDDHHNQIWHGLTGIEHQSKLLQRIQQKLNKTNSLFCQ
mgnify:CR=1 FL=1